MKSSLLKMMTVLILVFVVCVTTAIAQELPQLPNEKVLDKIADPVGEKTGIVYALLVGYNVFERNPMHIAEYSKNDVSAMHKRLLEEGVPPENIVCMTGDEKAFYLRPSRANILAMLQSMASHAGKNDTLFVMLGGIGAQVDDEACYLPMGTTTMTNGKGWIAESEIHRILLNARSHKTVLFGLYDRLMNRSEAVAEIIRMTLPDTVVEVAEIAKDAKSHVTINSCSSGGFAEESKEVNNDLFLTALLTIAKERNAHWLNDLTTLFPSVQETVSMKTADREGGPQTPQMRIWTMNEMNEK